MPGFFPGTRQQLYEGLDRCTSIVRSSITQGFSQGWDQWRIKNILGTEKVISDEQWHVSMLAAERAWPETALKLRLNLAIGPLCKPGKAETEEDGGGVLHMRM